uniref:Uncharacterized protein LOC114329533 isoform X3 n=1 Tax=Diabrotica virgifera virgifera TaxID=50390 RepID=A0A6P7FN97_DIAVI
MKCIIIVATVLCVLAATNAAHNKEQVEHMRKAHEYCQSQEATRIDEIVYEKRRNGEKVDEKKLAKHTLCINVQAGLQKENGDINVDKLRELLNDGTRDLNLINRVVEKCSKKEGDTTEDAAVNLVKCIASHGR